MDKLLLEIYTRESYFYIEKEDDTTITVSEKRSSDFDNDDKVDFWKKVLPLLDYEPVLIELNITTDSKINVTAKVETGEKLHLYCLLRLPKVFINKKTNTYYIKSFIDIQLVNEFKFENDSLDIVLRLLSKYHCIFGKERLYNDSLRKDKLIVNFCAYIPLFSISSMTILK